ncbi:hypothetical protein FACS189449_07040 [Alphaproteobacteria bacterium]|nr:hypothetical protein FACS189449_07040 [Alphaproteobacteria bacterium]
MTYNRANMLQEALCSICEQTAQGFKIKILDNCSTDNTKDVVEKIKKLYPQREIEFIGSDKNTGPSGNFVRAQKLAFAEYAMVFHDDDIMHREYISISMNLLSKNKNATLLLGACTRFYDEKTCNNDRVAFCYKKKHNVRSLKDEIKTVCYIGSKQDLVAWFLLGIDIAVSSAIYRTEYLNSIPLSDLHKHEYGDRIFLLDIVPLSKKVILVRSPYIYYRIHSEQDSCSLKRTNLEAGMFSLFSACSNAMRPMNLKHMIIHKVFYYNHFMDIFYYVPCKEKIAPKAIVKSAIKKGLFSNFDKCIACIFRRKYMLARKVFEKAFYRNCV